MLEFTFDQVKIFGLFWLCFLFIYTVLMMLRENNKGIDTIIQSIKSSIVIGVLMIFAIIGIFFFIAAINQPDVIIVALLFMICWIATLIIGILVVIKHDFNIEMPKMEKIKESIFAYVAKWMRYIVLIIFSIPFIICTVLIFVEKLETFQAIAIFMVGCIFEIFAIFAFNTLNLTKTDKKNVLTKINIFNFDKIFGIIFLLIGIVALSAFLSATHIDNPKETTGIIVSKEFAEKNDEGKVFYYPIVQYDVDGIKYVNKINCKLDEKNTKIEDKLNIIYNSENPNEVIAQMDNASKIASLVLSSLFIIIGMFFIVHKPKENNKKRKKGYKRIKRNKKKNDR